MQQTVKYCNIQITKVKMPWSAQQKITCNCSKVKSSQCKVWYRSRSALNPFPFNSPSAAMWLRSSALDVWRGKDHNLRSTANTFTLRPTWWIPKMRLTISHLSSRQQEGRPLERNSKVANLLLPPLTLMWRYIGRAVTDGEFGVLQSKLNLFQMAPEQECLQYHTAAVRNEILEKIGHKYEK